MSTGDSKVFPRTVTTTAMFYYLPSPAATTAPHRRNPSQVWGLTLTRLDLVSDEEFRIPFDSFQTTRHGQVLSHLRLSFFCTVYPCEHSFDSSIALYSNASVLFHMTVSLSRLPWTSVLPKLFLYKCFVVQRIASTLRSRWFQNRQSLAWLDLGAWQRNPP